MRGGGHAALQPEPGRRGPAGRPRLPGGNPAGLFHRQQLHLPDGHPAGAVSAGGKQLGDLFRLDQPARAAAAQPRPGAADAQLKRGE